MFRVPTAYKALKPFTGDGVSFAAGQTLFPAELVNLDLGVLISGRYLVPDVDPYARRGDPARGWGVTYIPGQARPAVTRAAAQPQAAEEPEPKRTAAKRRRKAKAPASKVAAEGQDGPAPA